MAKANGWNAVFWCNHDQPRAVSRFGDDKNYHNESAKMLAAAIHFMRGTPYIYQGEELGMTNADYISIEQYRDVESLNYYKILLKQGKSKSEALKIIGERSRDNGRTPMQWSAEKYAGFSSVEPWISSPDNFTHFNVVVEERDENSVLNFYKQLVRLRKSKKIISDGAIDFLERDNPNVLAYRRTLGNEELIVICNFLGVESKLAEKTLADYSAQGHKKLLGNYDGLAENLRPFEVVVLEK
ncbi:MAG: alpha-glucosidase C-terminal domain-containing protein [Selenomonadaceae bacterium]|nr:alpha-glucosidase C-terminal domain-containing protein [Selenomonadaceae bacterium]